MARESIPKTEEKIAAFYRLKWNCLVHYKGYKEDHEIWLRLIKERVHLEELVCNPNIDNNLRTDYIQQIKANVQQTADIQARYSTEVMPLPEN